MTVTCEKQEMILKLKEAGADEILFALADGAFTALECVNADDAGEWIKKIHSLSMSAGVLMNRLFHEGEIAEKQEERKKILSLGADRIYFQDPGLLHGLSEEDRKKMIYMPDTLMTGSLDGQFWMNLGLGGIMISPLLTENEILHIAGNVNHTGTEVFGYHMMSVSGRPLVTAFEEAYDFSDLKNQKDLRLEEIGRAGALMPVYEDDHSTQIYTDFIQDSFEEVRGFVQSGMETLLLSGIFLEDEVLLDGVKAYRSVMENGDMQCAGEFRKKYGNLPLSKGYYDAPTVR